MLVGGAVVVRAPVVTTGAGMPGSNVVAGAAVLVNGAMVVVAAAAVVKVLGTAVVVLGAAVEVLGAAVLATAAEVAESVVVATAAEVMSSSFVIWAAEVEADSFCRRGLQHTCREHAAPLHWLACCGGSVACRGRNSSTRGWGWTALRKIVYMTCAGVMGGQVGLMGHTPSGIGTSPGLLP